MKRPQNEKLISSLLETINPKLIADDSMRQMVELLLNFIEELNAKIIELEAEIQRLKDENNRQLKEQGKPDIKAKKPRGFNQNYSSEKERKTPKKHSKGRKIENIKIDREQIAKYPQDQLPADAEFKGYKEVVVQDIKLCTDNILFHKEKYYSPSEKKTYLAELPPGYEGEFGPGLKAFVISLYYGGNMTQSKLLSWLADLDISISAGQISNLLIKKHQGFERVTYELLSKFEVAQKWQKALRQLPQKVFSSSEFQSLLERHLPGLGPRLRTHILEAAAIARYQQSSEWPVVRTLVCDDAAQFKSLTENLSLCWVHEARHYKKLSPLVAYHRKLLEQFRSDFWDYYRKLLAYKEAPSATRASSLRAEFERLFGTETGYQQLDERKRLTRAKIVSLLLVLDHPELPLHNNPAELAARTMVQRRRISYGTQTAEGTKAWDTFLSLVSTTRKLGISFFEYVRDRLEARGIIPALATIIRERERE